MQPPSEAMSSVPDDALPELRFELPPFPGRLIVVRSGPPRPRGSTPPPIATGNDTEKSEAPTIVPQLTSQESAVAEQQTNQSLRIAESNLQSARGKNLNATQTDLVSKIRGFIKDAREAAQITDWSRARSLAKKAQVLSEELASSL
jgi:ribosomal protein S20